MGVINGTQLTVFTGGKLVAYSTDCKITISQEVRDTTIKNNGWGSVAEGKRKWSMSVDGLMSMETANTAFTTLFNYYINRTMFAIYFLADTPEDQLKGSYPWSGYAYLSSLEVNAPVEGSSTYNVTFEGTGILLLT